MERKVARLNRVWNIRGRCSSQRGQTMIFVVLGLGLVFLAVLGFAVDFGNLWFRRQAAQSAADAACTAAVMDMLWNTSGTSTKGNFPVGSPPATFTCTSGSAAAPCRYATLNGYNSSGLVANSESNSVQVAFPSSLSGNPVPVCPNPIPPSMKVCIPPAGVASSPFVQVTVTDRMRTAFFGLVSSSNTVDVPAKASCGLVLNQSPIPLLILDPTRDSTMILTGGSGLRIYGGPQTSIQVNSSNSGAFSKSGGKGFIDLSNGGPSITGSNMQVAVTQTTPPSTSNTAVCDTSSSGPDLCLGLTGSYGNHLPILDPFASLTAPSIPTFPTNNGQILSTPAGQHGCPAPTGNCDEYTPGYYPAGITVTSGGSSSGYAIFQPGIYYVVGGVNFVSNSCVRPSTQPGDGSGGTFFYFADNHSLQVSANSGCNRPTGGSFAMPATNFATKTGTGSYPHGAACDSTALANLPANLDPTSVGISGSVLLAPCTEPKDSTMCAPNCSVNGGTGFGDPLGPTDPAGIQRGMLFMQNRAQTLSNVNMPNWQGGGAFLLSGSMYFHQCVTSGSDTGTGCSTSAFTDQLTFGGNPAGTSYVLGDIVVDQLKLNGSPNLYMDLSPNSSFYIFKASLLQ